MANKLMHSKRSHRVRPGHQREVVTPAQRNREINPRAHRVSFIRDLKIKPHLVDGKTGE